MRCKYSFKEFIHSKILANYSFNKFIHSKKSEIIHSMKLFIHLKNGLSPTPSRQGGCTGAAQNIGAGVLVSCDHVGDNICCWDIGR